MLEIQGKIHDLYTLEFKVGYAQDNRTKVVGDFSMNTWIFVPDVLYINAKTYTKHDFYRDVRSRIRLITPVFTPAALASDSSFPLLRLREAVALYAAEPSKENGDNYKHQLKMFGSIVRSTVRTVAQQVSGCTSADEALERLETFRGQLALVLKRFRDLPRTAGWGTLTAGMLTCYALTDEYLCRVTRFFLANMQEFFMRTFPDTGVARYNKVMALFTDECERYQQQCGYIGTSKHDMRSNRIYLMRGGLLKKFIESDLYLLVHKRSNTFVWQQILFMLAAGLSMVFATVVSFSFQQTYGNFTRPLFIALVISYMLKDRIKDLLRYWFANKLGSKFYDYKTRLGLHGRHIGWHKEGIDFVVPENLPDEVKRLRGTSLNLETSDTGLQESVIFYRRRVVLFGRQLARSSRYPLRGVNEIIRVNLREFVRKMDNPVQSVPVYEGDGCYASSTAEKSYYLHFIVQLTYGGKVSYKRYRVRMTRRGVADFSTF